MKREHILYLEIFHIWWLLVIPKTKKRKDFKELHITQTLVKLCLLVPFSKFANKISTQPTCLSLLKWQYPLFVNWIPFSYVMLLHIFFVVFPISTKDVCIFTDLSFLCIISITQRGLWESPVTTADLPISAFAQRFKSYSSIAGCIPSGFLCLLNKQTPLSLWSISFYFW